MGTNLITSNKKWLSMAVVALVFVVVFLMFLFPVADADLGWHLRCGESFWATKQICTGTDFSYAMPNYHWINHSWGYDILLAPLFKVGGFTGLSLVAALLIAISFMSVFSKEQLKTYGFLSLLIFSLFCLPLLSTALRSQLVSFFLTVIMWMLLLLYTKTKKTILLGLFPLLFLFWANIHGQFIAGLGLMGLYVLGITYKQNIPYKDIRNLWLTVLLSSAVTFINPYGLALHQHAIEHFNTPVVEYIIEWQPWPLTSPLMLLLLAYSGLLWWGIYKQKSVHRGIILVLGALMIMAIKSRRVIPFYVLFSLPVFMTILDAWISAKPFAKYLARINLAGLVGLGLLLLILDVPSRAIFHQTWDSYCRTEVKCSEGLVHFLQDTHFKGRIFNAYRLGGHLLYRYPEEKVFIDGRMTLWHDTEGRFPFAHYLDMVYARPGVRDFFLQQKFEYVIVNHEYNLARVLANSEKWPIVYEDDTVVMFKNPLLTK